MSGGHHPTNAGLLAFGLQLLKQDRIDGAERDARILLAAAVGIPRDRMLMHMQDAPGEFEEMTFLGMIDDRRRRMPVSKILGTRMFWGRDFKVTAETLDPRPETETLIAMALEAPFADLLDLGTGTGVLAVTLLAERPEAVGVATDISGAALSVAEQNARMHDVLDRLWLTESDWFGTIGDRYDLIVSNPPYIAADEMPDLAPEVRDHDPHVALTDHADGLTAYRKISAASPGHLRPGGRLLVEIGPTQGTAVARLFRDAGLEAVAIHSDMDRRDRVVSGIMPGQSDTKAQNQR